MCCGRAGSSTMSMPMATRFVSRRSRSSGTAPTLAKGSRCPCWEPTPRPFAPSLRARHFRQPAKPQRGSHDPRSRRLSRQPRHLARGRPARRPANGEDISLDRGEAALAARGIRCRRAALRGRLVPARDDIPAIRRCARDRPHRGNASRRARRRADAQRARRQRGAGLGRCRSRHRGIGDRRAQPGQREAVARPGDRQRQAAVRVARCQFAQADRQCGDLDGAGLFDHRARSIRRK